MDFGAVLQTAKKIQETSKKDVRTYCTKFSPPKKEKKKDVTLSDNIKKFLARKEAEEKAKTMVTNKKRDDLLALRAQDKKATRRVSVMLKRTKSANQSVLADAVDVNNTADTLSGCAQPDEDDYGYVSQEAQALYNKLMERYSNMPKDDKFSNKKKASSNMMETKDRVRAALEKEKEDAMLPHKRKRKPKDSAGPEEEEKRSDSRVEREHQPAKRPKVSAPPPLSFSELLKIAEKKQHEPIVIEVKAKDDEGPLLTKKQKLELERQQQWKERKTREDPMPSPILIPNQLNKIPKLKTTPSVSKSVLNDISKVKSKPTNEVLKKPSTSQVPKSTKSCDPLKSKPEITKKPINSNCDNRNVNGLIKKAPDLKFGQPMSKEARMIAMNARSKELAAQQAAKNQPKPKQFPPADLKSKQLPPKDHLKPRQFPPTDLKPRPFPPTDLKSKQFPPRDLKAKQFPPGDLRPKQFPPGDVRRKPMGKKRMVIDSDEEYDSEMDDFIDDGPDEMEDYSKHIKEIFGYDKSKYRGAEEDVDNMESSFADQMREDKRSARLGLLEDLEDIKREKEEKKRKALKKKGVM